MATKIRKLHGEFLAENFDNLVAQLRGIAGIDIYANPSCNYVFVTCGWERIADSLPNVPGFTKRRKPGTFTVIYSGIWLSVLDTMPSKMLAAMQTDTRPYNQNINFNVI